MDTVLLEIDTKANPHIRSEDSIHRCMEEFMALHPGIKGYVFEFVGSTLNILMWGTGIRK